MSGLAESSVDLVQLVRALVLEVRGLRMAIERAGAVDYGPSHEALLASVRGLLGDSAFTSETLMQMAQGDGADAAMVRRALAELGLCNAFALGTYLRGRVGLTGGGLELRRIGLTQNKVARWSVAFV